MDGATVMDLDSERVNSLFFYCPAGVPLTSHGGPKVWPLKLIPTSFRDANAIPHAARRSSRRLFMKRQRQRQRQGVAFRSSSLSEAQLFSRAGGF